MKKYFEDLLFGYKLEAQLYFMFNQLLYWGSLFIVIISTLIVSTIEFNLGIELILFVFVSNETMSIFISYNIHLLTLLDIKKNKIITKRITLEKIDIEKVINGEKGGGSRIYTLYTKSFSADRFRLHFISDDRFGYVRVILGYKNYKELTEYLSKAKTNDELVFEIKYLKLSKVLYSITPCGEDSITKKRQQEMIDSVFVLEKPVGLLNSFKSFKNRK